MHSFDDRLWRLLEAMRIAPDGAALTFEKRLAREQKWSAGFTLRAMREYRRFLYLAATGLRPVTPSEAVDAAWHLHLTYSRHYWDELCGRILGRALHHDPTEGGPAQQAKFVDQYESTLARYEAVFGETPPADIWPMAERRFRQSPVRSWPRWTAVGGAAVALSACTALAANGTGGVSNGTVFAIVLGVLLVVALAMIVLGSRSASAGRRRNDGDGGAYGGGCGSSGRDGKDGDGVDAGDGGSGCGGGGCGGGGD